MWYSVFHNNYLLQRGMIMTKPKAKYSGRLRPYLAWPTITAVLFCILSFIICFMDLKAGIVAVIFTLCYIAVVIVLVFVYKPKVMTDLVSFAAQYGRCRNRCSMNFPSPMECLI